MKAKQVNAPLFTLQMEETCSSQATSSINQQLERVRFAPRNYLVFFSLDLKEEEMGYKIESVFIMVGIVSCLISAAHAAQGNAVFYDPPYTRKL